MRIKDSMLESVPLYVTLYEKFLLLLESLCKKELR